MNIERELERDWARQLEKDVDERDEELDEDCEPIPLRVLRRAADLEVDL